MGLLSRLLGGGAPAIDVKEAARRLDAGDLVLVDVREKREWQSGHAKGARHVPLSALSGKLSALQREGKQVAFVCASGHRSGSACGMAQRQGIEVANVQGGMAAWQRAGLPVVRAR